MKHGLAFSFLVGAAAILTAGQARKAEAHHSFAMYDQTQTVTVTGKLTRFITGANHAQLIFDVVGPDGKEQLDEAGSKKVFGVETGPAAQIAEQGITVKAFPIGTVVTITANPLRNGKPFGALTRGGTIIKCGMQMPKGGCNEKTGEVFTLARPQPQ